MRNENKLKFQKTRAAGRESRDVVLCNCAGNLKNFPCRWTGRKGNFLLSDGEIRNLHKLTAEIFISHHIMTTRSSSKQLVKVITAADEQCGGCLLEKGGGAFCHHCPLIIGNLNATNFHTWKMIKTPFIYVACESVRFSFVFVRCFAVWCFCGRNNACVFWPRSNSVRCMDPAGEPPARHLG